MTIAKTKAFCFLTVTVCVQGEKPDLNIGLFFTFQKKKKSFQHNNGKVEIWKLADP